MKNLKMKSARAAKDLSQQQLADLVGVSRQTINAIEKGDYNPTIRLCIAICKALDKTLDDLFWEAGYIQNHRDAATCICCISAVSSLPDFCTFRLAYILYLHHITSRSDRRAFAGRSATLIVLFRS